MKDNQIVKTDGGAEFPLSGELINSVLEWCRQIGESYYLEELLAEGPVESFEDLIAFHHRALPRAEARWGCLRGKVARIEAGAWVYGYSSFNLYVEEGMITFTYRSGKGDMFVEHDFAYVLYAESGHSFGRMLSFMEMLRKSGIPVSDGPLVYFDPVPEADIPHYMWRWAEAEELEEVSTQAGDRGWSACYFRARGEISRSAGARRRSRSMKLARRLKRAITEH